mmetsp:Transcript_21915/g.49884  ORF Transcript_21915/g.49884 Transcript_21915/m.49884 type:complete len:267 (+) Transcript_21915:756-1556(+)
MVSATYGADISSSLMEILTSPLATGEDISSDERNCDDILPLIIASPPWTPSALMTTGGHPVSLQLTSAPSWTRPSIRSAIGRSRILGTPSSTNLPFPMQSAAARGRIAVPAFPRNRSRTLASVSGESIGPALPVTVTSVEEWRTTSTPRSSRAPNMKRMSSDSRRFSTRVVPSERAARRRHRFDSDLDPGRVTVPSIDLMGERVKVFSDVTVMRNGKRGRRDEIAFVVVRKILFVRGDKDVRTNEKDSTNAIRLANKSDFRILAIF